jgi:MFS superfamily sulfate permease-like transporter
MTGRPHGSSIRTQHAMRLQDVAPGLRLLRTYRRHWLPKDVIAGIVLTTLLVPQGMAYAELAGLPPITGLYTTIRNERSRWRPCSP